MHSLGKQSSSIEHEGPAVPALMVLPQSDVTVVMVEVVVVVAVGGRVVVVIEVVGG